MEAADAVLGILIVVVLDETEPKDVSEADNEDVKTKYPLQRPVLRSMIDLELLISPKRRPQASSMSSVVSGSSPRMYTFVSPRWFSNARSNGLSGDEGAGIARGMAGVVVTSILMRGDTSLCSGCLAICIPYGPIMEVGDGVPCVNTPLGERLIATPP